MSPITLIIGSQGQDGRLLSENLDREGKPWLGVAREPSGDRQIALDLQSSEQVSALLKRHRPAQIYFFAAYHQSSEEKRIETLELFQRSLGVNLNSLVCFLEAIRLNSPESRLFYAASSHIFGDARVTPQTEETPFAPNNVYAITKVAGIHACRFYRAAHGVFAASGILYNHESRYRKPHFLTRKIVDAAIRIQRGEQETLTLGDLDAEVDWGYALEYVEAMRAILGLDRPDDFIIASGRKHSVRDFARITFELLDMDWEKHVRQDPGVLQLQRLALVGDASKLRAATGWESRTGLREMIGLLLKAAGVTGK